MMWLKGCPRCQGDLFEEAGINPEVYGARFVNCLQCGYTLTAAEETRLARAERRRLSSTAQRQMLASAAARA
ncbi:MAG TPA: hypothetical protein VFE37_10965 [Chloroflexota bacterium]|nr:hypothetical protein [Chloroflexota bacterium]